MNERPAFQPPSGRIEVVTRRGSNTVMIVLLLIFGGFGAVGILSSHIRNAPYLLIPLGLVLVFIIGFLVLRARMASVRLFDINGVTRGDGRHLPWSDFRGTVTRWSSNRFAGKSIWRIELYFNGGQAWILPSNIGNGKEVLDYVKSLPELR